MYKSELNPYNIDKEAHYFFETSKLEPLALNLFGIGMKSSNDPQTWVEAKIVEDRYKVDEGYKVTLEALDPYYGRENYYQEDFISLIKSGNIIKKDKEHKTVKHITWSEPLCGSVVIRYEADIVTV